MDEPAEKPGLRTAWGRVAAVYDRMCAARTAPCSAAGLELLDPPPGAEGLDVASGPGDTTVALAERLALGRALGVAFPPPMVERSSMRFADVAEAVEAAVLGGPLAGLFVNRLDDAVQDQVREALGAHAESLVEPDGAGISLPAEVVAAVGAVPAGHGAGS